MTGISAASGGAARWAKPEYDTAGNMIGVPNPRKPAELLRCKYDAWNRLVEVLDKDRKLIARYQYDGLGRRIVKQTKDTDGQDRWRHFFYSHDDQVIEEREAFSAREWPAFADRQHFWGIDGSLLFSEHGEIQTKVITYPRRPISKVTFSALTARLYAMRDALGSTTALLNDSSELAGRFSYQPYGELRTLNNDFSLAESSPWHAFDYLFAGYRYDHETGLYHTSARQYHPLLGVWTSRDPAGYVDGLNLYQYVASSPTNFIDPTGEAIPIVALIIVGAIVGGAHGLAETYAAANVADREPELWELGLGGTLGAVFGAVNPVGELFSAGGALVGGLVDASTPDGQFLGTGFQAGGLVGGVAGGFGTAARNAAGVGTRYAMKRAAITIAPELAGATVGATYGVATGASAPDTLNYATWGMFGAGGIGGFSRLLRNRQTLMGDTNILKYVADSRDGLYPAFAGMNRIAINRTVVEEFANLPGHSKHQLLQLMKRYRINIVTQGGGGGTIRQQLRRSFGRAVAGNDADIIAAAKRMGMTFASADRAALESAIGIATILPQKSNAAEPQPIVVDRSAIQRWFAERTTTIQNMRARRAHHTS